MRLRLVLSFLSAQGVPERERTVVLPMRVAKAIACGGLVGVVWWVSGTAWMAKTLIESQERVAHLEQRLSDVLAATRSGDQTASALEPATSPGVQPQANADDAAGALPDIAVDHLSTTVTGEVLTLRFNVVNSGRTPLRGEVFGAVEVIAPEGDRRLVTSHPGLDPSRPESLGPLRGELVSARRLSGKELKFALPGASTPHEAIILVRDQSGRVGRYALKATTEGQR